MRHAILILGCFGATGLAACAAPVSSSFDGKDAGPDHMGDLGDAHDLDGNQLVGIAPETYGAGVTAQDADVFKHSPGAAAPFVFDPPSGAMLPNGWPSPEMLTHTDDAPALVRLELDYGNGRVAAFTAKPESAPRSDPNTTDVGSWWTVRFPVALFEQVKVAAVDGTLKWRVLYANGGDATPRGAQSGTLRFLPGGEQPDVSFWQISGGQTFTIERLKVGAKSTKTLVPQQSACIGCHTTAPDGKDIALNDFSVGRHVDVVRPQVNGPPTRSPVVTPTAASVLDGTTLLIPTVSAGAWSDTDGRWIAAAYTANASAVEGPFQLGLLQIDGAKAHIDVLQGGGEVTANSDVLPAWSPDGKRIVFVRTNKATDGYLAQRSYAPKKTADLYSVAVTTVAGGSATFGVATPVPGASGTPELETYPSFSADGALLAYMRVDADGGGYDEGHGDIFVTKADGSGTPVRIVANDAPSDGPAWANGQTNSWPRFGKPLIQAPEGTYYPLIFSSRRGSSTLWGDKYRGAGRPFARLVYTVILVKTDGTVQSFPGAIVPGQRVDAGAHCPDYVTVTSVPPPLPN